MSRPDYMDTYCVCDGEDLDHVNVWVDSSPAEPDVNWHGSFEVTAVELLDGTSIIGRMTTREIEDLEERLYQSECEAAEQSECEAAEDSRY